MNTTTLAPPQAMLERLRDAGANPAVTEVERNQAIDWLRCLLVDFTALNAHIALLQQLNGNALFCFPAPRRDGGPLAPSSPDPRFRFSAVWSNERIVPILDGGLEVLKNDELGQLLLNPYALADLHDVISEVGADAWMPVIQDVGREMMRRDGGRPKNSPLKVRLAPVPAATMPFTAKPSKPAAYGRWTGPWTMAVLGGVAAAVAVTVAVFSFGQARDAIARVAKLEAELKQLRDRPQNSPSGPEHPLHLTANKANTPIDWERTLANHYNPGFTPEENLEHLENLSGAVKAEAARMRREQPTATAKEILDAIFEAWGKPKH